MIPSYLGYLTLDFDDKYPEKYYLLKKLAFTEVYSSDSNNQVTLLIS